MRTEQLALVQGWDDTRTALRRRRGRPLSVLGPWTLGALGVASRRGAWKDLLAATFVTVGIAAPALVGTGLVEVHVTPDVLRALP